MLIYIQKFGSQTQGATYLEYYLASLTDGTYQVDIRKARDPKTKLQRGWLWNHIYPTLLDGLIDAGWEFTSVDEVHEFFKQLFASHKVVNRFTGELLVIPESTAEMDTCQYSAYCEQLRDYGLEFLNVEIRDPDKNWKVNRYSKMAAK